MNNFTQRIVSGAVYVAVVVSSILVHPMYFGAVFLVVTLLAIREFHTLVHSSALARILSMISGGLLFSAGWFAMYYGQHASQMPSMAQISTIALLVGAAAMLVFIALITELFLKQENPITEWGHILISQFMLALPFTCMNLILSRSPYYLLALFIAIWINDSGAYCVGSLTAKRKQGNHKMFPRVSPNKSWEGLVGGIIWALLAGWVFYAVGWFSGLGQALGFAALVSVFGTLGDLMESLLKRTLGVKDSGRFMPGHGGVLDRFDSILLAAPVLMVYVLAALM